MSIAIVTGAAKGIGAATAKRLASDGLDVALFDIDVSGAESVANKIEADGGRAIAVYANVGGTLGSVVSAVNVVVHELGEPTVLVSNAGVIRDNRIAKMSELDWQTVLRVHLNGLFNMVKATQDYMVSAGYGRIVTISSSSALGNFGQLNYSAAKAGIQGATKTLAKELGPAGITANSVAPGFIKTDMTAATAARLRVSFEDFQAAVAKQTPLGRVGEPEDVAGVVSFLVGPDAAFVSGQVIYVAGGPLC